MISQTVEISSALGQTSNISFHFSSLNATHHVNVFAVIFLLFISTNHNNDIIRSSLYFQYNNSANNSSLKMLMMFQVLSTVYYHVQYCIPSAGLHTAHI